MFLALKQLNPDRTYWVNDLNEEVFLFWKVLRDDPERLIEEIHHLRNSALSGADLFQKLWTVPKIVPRDSWFNSRCHRGFDLVFR